MDRFVLTGQFGVVARRGRDAGLILLLALLCGCSVERGWTCPADCCRGVPALPPAAAVPPAAGATAPDGAR